MMRPNPQMAKGLAGFVPSRAKAVEEITYSSPSYGGKCDGTVTLDGVVIGRITDWKMTFVKYGVGVPPGEPFHLTDAQLKEWRKR